MPLAQFVGAVLVTLVAPNAFAQNCPVTNVETADQRGRRDDAVQYAVTFDGSNCNATGRQGSPELVSGGTVFRARGWRIE